MEKQISGLRFDLAAKTIYIKSRIAGIESLWYLDMYKQHIRVFNGGWEIGGTKRTVQDFVNVFNKLIDEFDIHKAGIIPVGSNNIIINGAHRTTIALVKKVQLAIARQPRAGKAYDYNFFMNRYKYNLPTSDPPRNNFLPHLDRVYSDELACEFCRICPNLRIVTMFPAAVGKGEQMLKIIKKYGSIVYALSIDANLKLLDNLIKELYRGEGWIGGFTSAKSMNKSKCCWNSKNPKLQIYLLSPSGSCTALKKELRTLYNIGNHSVHINDTHEETFRIASSVFNANSRHFLNTATFNLNPQNQQLYKHYQATIGANKNNYCIVSSYVLALYGLRAARDLDYIHHGPPLARYPGVDSHNSYTKQYPLPIDDIIYNPRNHLYVGGIKICSLQVLKAMKEKRAEPKDITDVGFINAIINKDLNSTIIFS